MLLVLSFLLAAAPGGGDGAVERAAEELSLKAVPDPAPARLALLVSAPGCAPLREPFLTALSGALARRAQTVVPLSGAEEDDVEGAARARGADALLRVRVTLSAEELTVLAEWVPTRENFFLQHAVGARPAGARLLTVVAAPDDAARALLGPPARPRPGPIVLRPLAELGGRLLALAAGPTRPGAVRLFAVTTTAVLLLDAHGALLDERGLPPRVEGPRVRDVAAVAAVGEFGAGRIAYAVAGRAEGEILAAPDDRLTRVEGLPGLGATLPIAAGGAGILFGSFVPGRGVLEDLLALEKDPAARPASGRELFGAAAAPHPGRAAFAVLDCDYTLRILGPTLGPAFPDLPMVGVGFALADLEGGGEPLLIASEASSGPRDRLRVLAPGAPETVLFEAEPGYGPVVAAASADLTGDGLDDVVVATSPPEGGTRLWLVTADASGDPR